MVCQCGCNAAKLLPTVAPQFPKAVLQSTSAKRLPQSGYASNLFPKAILQSGSRKLLPKVAPQSCGSSKLPCEAAPQSCSLNKLLPKAVPLRCSTKLCPKLFSKAVAPKLRKAAPQSCCCPKLPTGLESCPKLLPKAATQSCSPALLPKVVPQSCSPKLLP